MLYKHIIRPFLFRFPAETSHRIVLKAFSAIHKFPLGGSITKLLCRYKSNNLNTNVFGIDFPNPVGLAAGMDNDAEHFNAFSCFGFSFMEVGSLTPEAQKGNERPRVFRLPKDKAIINRIGIENKGILNAIQNLKQEKHKLIIAGNIAQCTQSMSDSDLKNDFKRSFSFLYDFVDFFTINISYKSQEGMQNLQDASFLSDLLDPILDFRICNDVYKPILIKISPDLPNEVLDDILRYCMLSGIDGIVAGNSTQSRDGLVTKQKEVEGIGPGGLSGAPLFEKSLAKVKYIKEFTKGRLPIVGCGGIMTPEQAKEMLDAGASLIEVCTGFVYEGPMFVKRILRYLDSNSK